MSLKHRFFVFSCCYQKCPQGGSTVSYATRAPRLTGSLQRAAFQGSSGHPVPRLVSFDIFSPSPAPSPPPRRFPSPAQTVMLRVISERARSLGRHRLPWRRPGQSLRHQASFQGALCPEAPLSFGCTSPGGGVRGHASI